MEKTNDHITKQEVLELLLRLLTKSKRGSVWVDPEGDDAYEDSLIDVDRLETAIIEEMV